MNLMFCAAALGLATSGLAQTKNPNRLYQLSELKTVQLGVNGKSLKVWLADTASKRQEGMMFLKSAEVPASGAMLFVFEAPQALSFWMKNTLIPLDIAYIDAKGKVVTVKSMKALDETGVPSLKPAKYALEMKLGALSKWGIKVGTTFKIPSSVVAK